MPSGNSVSPDHHRLGPVQSDPLRSADQSPQVEHLLEVFDLLGGAAEGDLVGGGGTSPVEDDIVAGVESPQCTGRPLDRVRIDDRKCREPEFDQAFLVGFRDHGSHLTNLAGTLLRSPLQHSHQPLEFVG